jgi:hypothetical protein
MEEEERAIRAMPFVTTLSFVRTVKGKAEGWRVTLTCFACREYNSCGKKQEASVDISGERPTLFACLQELRKRLEEHHGNCAQALTEKDAADAASAATVYPDAPNVLQAMMQLEQAKTRAKTANRLALAHDIPAEVDNWDLRDHRREEIVSERTLQLVKTHAYDTCSESPCKRDAMRKQVGARVWEHRPTLLLNC